MKKLNAKMMAQLGLLIAMEIVLSRFLSISTPIVKIGFAFLPLAIVGIMYGPVYAGIAGGISDFIGAILFPIGAYFPGFTLTAALTGAVFGLLLYKNASWLRITIAVTVTCLALSLCLNTLWLSMLWGEGYLGLIPPRILQNVVMIPIEIVGIRLAWNKICNTKWMASLNAV